MIAEEPETPRKLPAEVQERVQEEKEILARCVGFKNDKAVPLKSDPEAVKRRKAEAWRKRLRRLERDGMMAVRREFKPDAETLDALLEGVIRIKGPKCKIIGLRRSRGASVISRFVAVWKQAEDPWKKNLEDAFLAGSLWSEATARYASGKANRDEKEHERRLSDLCRFHKGFDPRKSKYTLPEEARRAVEGWTEQISDKRLRALITEAKRQMAE